MKKRKTARTKTKPTGAKKWSARVTRSSDALDLPGGIFTQSSARAIAKSLKKSAESSTRRKSAPFRSAMSMLNFEINRAGKNLGPGQRDVLNRAKAELRRLYGRPGRRSAGRVASYRLDHSRK
jgi:hypothetical protein